MSEAKKKFERDGYLIIDLDLNAVDLDQIILDMNKINASEQKKLNPEIYHYNEFPRLIEAWKQSEPVKSLALDSTVIATLRELYGQKPLPFSTINFTKGTEQPLHSDYFHFGSMPELMLAGVWVALQDIDPDSGPLAVAPGSHKGPIVLPEDLGITKVPKSMNDVKENYTVYEEYLSKFIADNEFEVITPKLKKGQALIWAANMLHGAGAIANREVTRYSQVTHYHFDGCDFFYNPNFSTRKKYVKRDLSESIIN